MQQRSDKLAVSAEIPQVPDASRQGMMKGLWYLTVLLGLSLAIVAPFISHGLSFWFYLLQAIVLASGLNLMAGFTGYLPFGYAAFYGLGAYTVGITVQLHALPVAFGLLAAAGVGGLAAAILVPTLRLSGIFFSITSFALAAVVQLVVSDLPESIAGGGSGIAFTERRDPLPFYYLMLGLAAVTIAAATAIAQSRYGLMLKAIKDDPVAAAATGINVPLMRFYAWLLSAVVASTAGAIEALYTSIIDPATAFNVLITAKAIIFAAVGGLGTVMGPVMGAIIFSVVDEMIWSRFPTMNLFILGAVIVFVVLYLPRGIVGTILQHRPKLRGLLY